MPDKKTIERAREDKRQGKSPTTQAGEFVREEIHHIREGKHGARSTKQAIAIGLSKARRAGVDLPPPRKGKTTERTRKSAERAYARGQGEPPKRPPSAKTIGCYSSRPGAGRKVRSIAHSTFEAGARSRPAAHRR